MRGNDKLSLVTPAAHCPTRAVLTLLVSSRGAVSHRVLKPHGGMLITGQKAECPSLGTVCAQHIAGQAGSLFSRASVQPVESSGHSCGPGAPLPAVIRLRSSPPGRQAVPSLVTLFQMK
ncbi:unnamed protein product [Rangifer tarandus platyrhynchus]|uniref:Uncharacterized protein n=1 Tax=Rangifer tarandus platyrhynchus TaxID=3082113 RepID=A0AC59ZF84_RANTA